MSFFLTFVIFSLLDFKFDFEYSIELNQGVTHTEVEGAHSPSFIFIPYRKGKTRKIPIFIIQEGFMY